MGNGHVFGVWRPEYLVIGYSTLNVAHGPHYGWAVVYLRDFADEQEAVEYAIASQRNRRNLTEAEIVRCILALDNLRAKGGDRKSDGAKSIASVEAIEKSPLYRSSAETAKLVGADRSKVERVRRLQRQEPDLLQEVIDGKRMVNGARLRAGSKTTARRV